MNDTWLDAKPPASFEELEKRNPPGRTFEVNQFNARQLQLDVEWLIRQLADVRRENKRLMEVVKFYADCEEIIKSPIDRARRLISDLEKDGEV